ncbi:hypothetical protein G7085_11080 [Tessaracoccus sp. HDW20]|nr:hypothetical protein [Tessaracoccus coleopterorum]
MFVVAGAEAEHSLADLLELLFKQVGLRVARAQPSRASICGCDLFQSPSEDLVVERRLAGRVQDELTLASGSSWQHIGWFEPSDAVTTDSPLQVVHRA